MISILKFSKKKCFPGLAARADLSTYRDILEIYEQRLK